MASRASAPIDESLTGTSRQPSSRSPSDSTIFSTPSQASRASSAPCGRNAMPVAYAPSAGSSKSTLSRRKRSGTCSMMPAPSPVLGSAPAAPRCSRLTSAMIALSTRSRLRRPYMSTTNATPQESCSLAGSYRPTGPGACFIIGLTSYAASPAHPSSRFRLRSQITWIHSSTGDFRSHSKRRPRPGRGCAACGGGTDLADCCVTQGCQGCPTRGWSRCPVRQRRC